MRERVLAWGYIIADEQGRIQHYTLAPNRTKCWHAFLSGIGVSKKEAMRQGFRATGVFIKGLPEAKP